MLVDAKAPVSFFAYPGKPSYLVPDGCRVLELAGPADDAAGSLHALADAVGATALQPTVQQASRPDRPSGALTAQAVCQAIGAVLPEGAIVSDESGTAGFLLPNHTASAPHHDVLGLTGGAIGQGLPVALGAAVASPGRPVLAVEGDGSGLYTIQSLWSMAREGCDVTVVLLNNRSYSILNMELDRVGAGAPGPRAKAQLDLSGPDLDFVAIAAGFGVPATRPESAEAFTDDLARSLAEPGPHLIEAVVPPIF